MLPELAVNYFDHHESCIKIITCKDDSRQHFMSCVELNKPGEKPVPWFSPIAISKTHEEILEVLMMTLRQAVAVKEEKAMRSARETFDKAPGAGATKGVAGRGSRS